MKKTTSVILHGFTVTHHGGIVTVEKFKVDPEKFADEVSFAQTILEHFPSSLTNYWGCDGIGYGIQKARGEVRMNKSTVGPKQFQKGLENINEKLLVDRAVTPAAPIVNEWGHAKPDQMEMTPTGPVARYGDKWYSVNGDVGRAEVMDMRYEICRQCLESVHRCKCREIGMTILDHMKKEGL